ncbi:MAG: YbhB/YbcL family Raf kinase inhibitor-like protein [Polyangiaceae bacterium]
MKALLAWTIVGVVAMGTAGCGGDGSGSGGSTTGGAGGSTSTGGTTSAGGAGSGGVTQSGGAGGAFTISLTSPALTEGGMFAVDNTCAGMNISPELDWTAGPAETKSYAIVLKDVTINLVHSAIWDIPAEALSLPADVDKDEYPADVSGARQAKAYDDTTYGYLGPCPNGASHNYRFTIYAENVANLPIIGIPSKDSVPDVALEHAVATGTLNGTSDAKAP